MNLSLVVLAAGASRRFGAANKLLQLLDGKPLLCHTLELAAALPVMQRTAVCSVETAPLAKAAGFTVLLNPQPELGQSHSLRLGLAACRESDGALIHPLYLPCRCVWGAADAGWRCGRTGGHAGPPGAGAYHPCAPAGAF